MTKSTTSSPGHAQCESVTSGAVSRAVIANIESGRKADVSVVQLLALAAALGVPPVALLLPLEEPEALVTVRPNDDRRAIDTLDWISGTSSEGHQTPAGKNARAILMGVRGYYRSLQQLRKGRVGGQLSLRGRPLGPWVRPVADAAQGLRRPDDLPRRVRPG